MVYFCAQRQRAEVHAPSVERVRASTRSYTAIRHVHYGSPAAHFHNRKQVCHESACAKRTSTGCRRCATSGEHRGSAQGAQCTGATGATARSSWPSSTVVHGAPCDTRRDRPVPARAFCTLYSFPVPASVMVISSSSVLTLARAPAAPLPPATSAAHPFPCAAAADASPPAPRSASLPATSRLAAAWARACTLLLWVSPSAAPPATFCLSAGAQPSSSDSSGKGKTVMPWAAIGHKACSEANQLFQPCQLRCTARKLPGLLQGEGSPGRGSPG